MELTGKIIQELQEQTGAGKKGQWRKQEYILETQSQYPKKVCFSVWGDKIDTFNIWKGDLVTIAIEAESREYNGRWFTELRAWKCDKKGSTRTAQDAKEERTGVSEHSTQTDDLPF